MANAFVEEIEKAVPSAAKLLEGDILDMWQLYQSAASQPEVFSELTLCPTLAVRDGLLFPDFFNAVKTFVREHTDKHKSTDRSTLERELEETFRAMRDNWNRYEPFFNRHPELRYMKRQSTFSFALSEFASKLPPVRSLDASLFWSLEEYHQIRGNLGFHVKLDEALRQQSLGTVFEKEGGRLPGTVLVGLKPYDPGNKGIAPYLPLLKHGDLAGFCRIALAEAGGKQFVAVTSLQTDLLRKDYVHGIRHDLGEPTTFSPDIRKNEDGQYTVPSNIGRPYLRKHAWVHKMLERIENAARDAAGDSGLEGIMVPTTCFMLDDGCRGKTIVPEGLSEYAQGSYDVVPGKRGYKKESCELKFPLTSQTGGGTCWIKSFK